MVVFSSTIVSDTERKYNGEERKDLYFDRQRTSTESQRSGSNREPDYVQYNRNGSDRVYKETVGDWCILSATLPIIISSGREA